MTSRSRATSGGSPTPAKKAKQAFKSKQTAHSRLAAQRAKKLENVLAAEGVASRAYLESTKLDGLSIYANGSYKFMSYARIANRSSNENSEAVRNGIKATAVRSMAQDLLIDQSVMADALKIPRSTLSRKLSKDELLSTDDSAKVLGIARIVGEVEQMLAESGDPEKMKGIDLVALTGEWLKSPVGALGNRRPMDYLDNVFGQETVLQLLRQMQAGSYA